MPGLADISSLVSAVRLRVAGADENTLAYALRTAARRFFIESKAWREDVDITTTLDVDDEVEPSYAITLTNTEAFIVQILSVRRVDDNTGDLMLALERDHYRLDRANDALVFEQGHIPGAEDEVYRVRMAIAPQYVSALFPVHLLELWAEGIVAAATSDLMNQRGKPWSDPNEAARQKEIELGFIDRAEVENDTEGTVRNVYYEA